MLKHTTLLFSLFFTGQLMAQSVTGSWYGRADVMLKGSTNNYLTELILKQKGNEIEGIFGYYFKDSYQSFFVRGTYNKTTREVKIPNLQMLHHSVPTRNGIECPMSFIGTLMVSKAQSTLKGSFITIEKYKYTCPELRATLIMDMEENQDSVLATASTGRKFWKPQQEDYVVTAPVNNKPVTNTAVIVKDTIALQPVAPTIDNSLTSRFEGRKNIFLQELEVESDSVRLSFYDNGDIDNDTITVFLDKNPVMVAQELSARALTLYIAMDDTKPVHEIGMLAENLGKYPPNTALMVVTDGVHRYEMYLTSSLTQNAVVRLRKKKKG